MAVAGSSASNALRQSWLPSFSSIPHCCGKRVDADDPHLTSPWSGGGIETPLYLTGARPTPIFIRTGRVAGIRLAAAHRLVSPMRELFMGLRPTP